jgi:hypothetical protein
MTLLPSCIFLDILQKHESVNVQASSSEYTSGLSVTAFEDEGDYLADSPSKAARSVRALKSSSTAMLRSNSKSALRGDVSLHHVCTPPQFVLPDEMSAESVLQAIHRIVGIDTTTPPGSSSSSRFV